MTANPSASHRLSVVVPFYNEGQSVMPLVEQVHLALADSDYPWELVLVNDGSSDNTEHEARRATAQFGPHVRLVNLQRNFGQTAAMQAGIDTARGDVIATMDGDLQNDPADIMRMVRRLLDEDLDLVSGWRRDRKDNYWLRKLPSRLANRLIGRITQVQLHDYGCSLKVYRASVLKHIRLYGEMHRFIPAWIASQTSPARIKEEVVTHHHRQYGVSKYGIGRTFLVLIDLLSVYFFMRFKSRPGHFFGRIGLLFGGAGGLMLAYLLYIKFVLGEDIGTRPLLLAAVLLVVVAVQFLTTGVLSEMISRIYYESGQATSYMVRADTDQQPGPGDGWKTAS
jgi:glycosyltransferase involved in cell wall biosynthesis